MNIKVGDYVRTQIELKDELGEIVPQGTILQIVAIVPKVTSTSKLRINLWPKLYDNRVNFFNAVRIGSEVRIRANFVTIKKLTKKEKGV